MIDDVDGETDTLMNKVFLDTSYAVALSSPGDETHKRAAELAHQLEASSTQFITTRAVLLEIGNTPKPRIASFVPFVAN